LTPGVSTGEIRCPADAPGRQAELHVYAKGGPGFGMAKRGIPIDHWIERFGEWLDGQGLMKLPN
jgi:hypothetical protein